MPRASRAFGPVADEPLRAFVYDRTSRDPYGRGTANRDQNIENERLCQEYNWVIAGRFSDPGKSASRHAKRRRDDFDAMVERVQRGEADVLVVWEASRAYRDLEVYVQLRNLCVKHRVLLCYDGTVYDMTNSDDRYRTGQDALQAEREADKIRDRVLRTVRLNAERGRPHGRLPYGYRRVYDQHTGELLEQVPHEEQAPIVKEIAQRAAGGQSLYRIAQDLNDRGVPGPTGGPWNRDIIPDLITKPTYVGKRQHQGRVIGKAEWKPILDEETYDACVRLFADPARKTANGNAVKYLLSGIARCSQCKGQCRPRRSYDREKWSYTCVTCFKTQIRTPVLDVMVTEAVLEHVERPEFADSLIAGAQDEGAKAARLEIEAYEAQLAEARELAGKWENGRVLLSALSLAKLEQQLLPLIDQARVRAQSASVPQVLRELAGAGARARWALMADDLVWQRSAIRGLVVPWLNPAGKGVRTIKPGRVRLEWLY